MKHYAVVIVSSEANNVEFTYNGREAFITTRRQVAEAHLQFMQEWWPKEKYQIVSFDVKEE
jgi:hypothetical protein